MHNSPNDIQSIGWTWSVVTTGECPSNILNGTWMSPIPVCIAGCSGETGLYAGKTVHAACWLTVKFPFAQAGIIEFPYAAGFQLVEIGERWRLLVWAEKGKHTIRLENGLARWEMFTATLRADCHHEYAVSQSIHDYRRLSRCRSRL